MGSARHRSWSHTRQFTFDGCPRALYYAYFPWGDENQNLARFLKRAATPESVAGTIVHRRIALGLRQLVKHGTYPTGMDKDGAAQYDEILRISKHIAERVRDGKCPPDDGTCFFHHLYGAEDPVAEQRGRDTIVKSLTMFETSTAMHFLKTTNFNRWKRILNDSDDVPSFYASAELGFESAHGLRVYAAYDLAFLHDGEFHIIDWKTGSKSGRSISASRRQLATYGLWALSQHHPFGKIRVQAFYLQDGEPWDPTPLGADDVKSVIRQIEDQDAAEREATSSVVNRDGEIIRYEADYNAFPPKPDLVGCGWCPYRVLCPEGRETVSGPIPASAL